VAVLFLDDFAVTLCIYCGGLVMYGILIGRLGHLLDAGVGNGSFFFGVLALVYLEEKVSVKIK